MTNQLPNLFLIMIFYSQIASKIAENSGLDSH